MNNLNNNISLQIPPSFTVFRETVNLLLKRSDKLLSPHFQVWIHTDSGLLKKNDKLGQPQSCHYLHKDDHKSAAINFCEQRKTVRPINF